MAVHGREFGEIGEDEPVFVVRAKDRAAPATLRHYAVEAERVGADPSLVLSVKAHADRMEEWQAAHGSKVPDLK